MILLQAIRIKLSRDRNGNKIATASCRRGRKTKQTQYDRPEDCATEVLQALLTKFLTEDAKLGGRSSWAGVWAIGHLPDGTYCAVHTSAEDENTVIA
jgi:hypothetical protein